MSLFNSIWCFERDKRDGEIHFISSLSWDELRTAENDESQHWATINCTTSRRLRSLFRWRWMESFWKQSMEDINLHQRSFISNGCRRRLESPMKLTSSHQVVKWVAWSHLQFVQWTSRERLMTIPMCFVDISESFNSKTAEALLPAGALLALMKIFSVVFVFG